MNETIALSEAADEKLVELSLEHDREAFAELVNRYRSLVCSLSYSIVGDVDQSEDVAQETFVIAWKKLRQLTNRRKFRAWLCGIVRNTAHGSVRKTQRISKLFRESEQHPLSEENDPADEIMSREEADLLWKSLERVPEKYREPLILFYREDQSVAKVADQLGLSTDAVKQRLSRGRAIVRDDIQRRLGDMLAATRPGPIFTAAVIGALPGMLTASAAAAGSGAVGKSAAASSVATGAGAGLLGGLGGAFFGWWASDQTARYQSQRDLMRRSFIGSMAISAVFLAGGFFWAWRQKAPFFGPGVFSLLWSFLFLAVLGIWCWRMGVKSREMVRIEQKKGTSELPRTPIRMWLQKWEGRKWNSPATFLGWPLISIAFTDPDRDFSGVNDFSKGIARGWIALGDKAYGLIAFGNFAVGGFAFGSLSFGLFAFGGLAAGGIAFGGATLAVLSLGGLALGFAALGGASFGWWAFGGSAIGYEAASGGFAAAREYAVGGVAYAAHANDSVANRFVEDHAFFHLGNAWTVFVASPWYMIGLFAAVIAVCGIIYGVGFKRRSS